MHKLIIANLKMNPATAQEAAALAKALDAPGLVIAPPFPFLPAVAGAIKKASLGAQDLFWEDGGPFTGEVSGSQLAALGVRYVIVGHSERRRHLGETDEMVARKTATAAMNHLTPILCVGETADERGAGETEAVVEHQLKVGLSLALESGSLKEIIIAYEPVWAIGAGTSDTPESAVAVAAFVRRILRSPEYGLDPTVIYGGSVSGANASDFLKQNDIKGALVGGASLKPEEMRLIMNAARENSHE